MAEKKTRKRVTKAKKEEQGGETQILNQELGKNDDAGKGLQEAPTNISGTEIKERLLEAGNDDDLTYIREVLMAEGVNHRTIRAHVHALRKAGRLSFQSAIMVTDGKDITKPSPIEVILRSIRLPRDMSNGQADVFNSGVEYGMKSVIAGVRLAQELSTMSIAQTNPLIRLAVEMRKAEFESAQEAGRVAADRSFAGAIGVIEEALSKQQGKTDIATVPNPMQGVMARMFENLMGRMMSGFGGGQQTQGVSQSQIPPGWVDARTQISNESISEQEE